MRVRDSRRGKPSLDATLTIAPTTVVNSVRSTAAKAALLRIRIEEKQRKLVRREDVDALIDAMSGVVLTHLSGMSARCTRDLAVRRAIDTVVDQVRREISAACLAKADEWNEPPLDEQG